MMTNATKLIPRREIIHPNGDNIESFRSAENYAATSLPNCATNSRFSRCAIHAAKASRELFNTRYPCNHANWITREIALGCQALNSVLTKSLKKMADFFVGKSLERKSNSWSTEKNLRVKFTRKYSYINKNTSNIFGTDWRTPVVPTRVSFNLYFSRDIWYFKVRLQLIR